MGWGGGGGGQGLGWGEAAADEMGELAHHAGAVCGEGGAGVGAGDDRHAGRIQATDVLRADLAHARIADGKAVVQGAELRGGQQRAYPWVGEQLLGAHATVECGHCRDDECAALAHGPGERVVGDGIEEQVHQACSGGAPEAATSAPNGAVARSPTVNTATRYLINRPAIANCSPEAGQ